MHDVYDMFELSGVKVPNDELDKLFPLTGKASRNLAPAKSQTLKIGRRRNHLIPRADIPVEFDDFKTAVLSKDTTSRFRKLMKKVRSQV